MSRTSCVRGTRPSSRDRPALARISSRNSVARFRSRRWRRRLRTPIRKFPSARFRSTIPMGSDRLLVGAAVVVVLQVSVATAWAQGVILQIRPRVGDTLAVRLDQEVEMVGVPVGCEMSARVARPKKAADRSCADSERSMLTRTEIFSRAIARRSKGSAMVMLAVTDSIRTATGTSRATIGRMARLEHPHSPVEIVMAPDGGVELLEEGATDELRSVFGQMPATLARKPVAVGEKWTREMLVPLPREPGASGRVRAAFRLDSLGHNGDMAFITMRGELSHSHPNG